MAVNARTISDNELFFGHKACAGCGGSLAVVNTPPQAKKVLVTAGIHRLVDIG